MRDDPAGCSNIFICSSTCGCIPSQDFSWLLLLLLSLALIATISPTIVAIPVAVIVTIAIAVITPLLLHPIVMLGMVFVYIIFRITGIADWLLIVTAFE